jgi:SMC interacting uncharacterized protein involved in chromosome segregation
MTTERKWLEDELQSLRTLRDELRVQMNLAGKEARTRFEEVEKKWHHLEGRFKVVGAESKESLDRIGDAARGVVHEIREAYQHIRSLL